MELEDFIYLTETKSSLPNITYKGIHIWLGIRKHIYPKIAKGIFKFESPTGTKLLKLLLNAFYGLKYWFYNYDFWFFSSTSTRKPVNGFYRDIFTDHISEKLPKSWKLEYTLTQHYSKKYIPFRRVSSMLLLVLFEKIFSFFLTNNDKIKKIELEILNHFNNLNPNDIDIKHSIKKIVGQYYVMKILLILKKKPKAAFFVSAYSYYGYIKALKEKSVIIIELQHGVINKSHVGYVIYSNYPKVYFPDFLLSYGTKEKDVAKHPNKFSENSQIIPVGSYIIDYYSKNNYISPEKELLNLIQKFQLSFCVSLQDCEIGFTLISWIIKIANDNPNYIFILKPRRTAISFYKANYTFPSNIVFNNSHNIYELILLCDYHITAYSTTALEAPSLGKPNILFNIDNKALTYYGNLLTTNKTTFYLNDPSDFHEILSKIKFKSRQDIIDSNSHVFRTNYQKNLNEFLSLILNTK